MSVEVFAVKKKDDQNKEKLQVAALLVNGVDSGDFVIGALNTARWLHDRDAHFARRFIGPSEDYRRVIYTDTPESEVHESRKEAAANFSLLFSIHAIENFGSQILVTESAQDFYELMLEGIYTQVRRAHPLRFNTFLTRSLENVVHNPPMPETEFNERWLPRMRATPQLVEI